MKTTNFYKSFLFEFTFSIGSAGLFYVISYELMLLLSLLLAFVVVPGRFLRKKIFKEKGNENE